MAIELKKKNFKVIILKNVEIEESNNGNYSVKGNTFKGNSVNLSVNEALLDDLNQNKVFKYGFCLSTS